MSTTSLIRVIALIAGVSFFGAGIYLMVQGISTAETLNIASSLVSGSMQSGSAGVFVAFLSTIIIIFAIASGDASKRNRRRRTFYIAPVTRRLAWVLATLLLVAVAAALAIPASGAENLLHSLLKGVFIAMGFASSIIFVALLFTIFDWDDEEELPSS